MTSDRRRKGKKSRSSSQPDRVGPTRPGQRAPSKATRPTRAPVEPVEAERAVPYDQSSTDSVPPAEWIGGLHACRECLRQHPDQVHELRLAKGAKGAVPRQLEEVARAAGVKFSRVRRQDLDALLPGITHQGVAIRRNPAGYQALEDVLAALPERRALLVALDEVTDPHNLGAILRSAWAFEVDALIIPKHRAAGLTATAVKAAAGAVSVVPTCRVGNLRRSLAELKAQGFWIFGADANGEVELAGLDLEGRVVLVFGAEGKGLRTSTQKICDGRFRIPMSDAAGSLNVSVAAGIALHQAYLARSVEGRSKPR